MLRVARIGRAGGGGLSPRWNLPEKDYHKYTYQPTIPDKHYNVPHLNYAPITLFLRNRRPYMEKIGKSVYGTAMGLFEGVTSPIVANVERNLPGFGYKLMGFLGALIGYNVTVMYWLDRTQAYMDLEKLAMHEISQDLYTSGFFNSESEDVDERMHSYNMDALRFEDLWDAVLSEATQKRDWSVVLSYLTPEKCAEKPLVEPIAWRFNMMPYGRDCPDTYTFPTAPKDTPPAAVGSGSFGMDPQSVGDYIERVDNKGEPIRKARHMYCAAYMPPTK